MEATPSYMLGFNTAMVMGDVVPFAKVILLLRNPVDRFFSE